MTAVLARRASAPATPGTARGQDRSTVLSWQAYTPETRTSYPLASPVPLTEALLTEALPRPVPAGVLYAEALRDASARPGGRLVVRRTAGHGRGTGHLADLARWCGGPSRVDRALLRRCAGPTLDLGCGPGRLTAALGAADVPALGVDLCRTAVALTRARGADALHRSLFSVLPAEGRWAHVLLADGNIGIGGDPVTLLRRCGALLARRTGTALVEVGAPGSPTGPVRQRLEYAGRRSADFGWAHVAVDALAAVAAAAGLRLEAAWADGGRWFGCLRSS